MAKKPIPLSLLEESYKLIEPPDNLNSKCLRDLAPKVELSPDEIDPEKWIVRSEGVGLLM